MVDWAKKNGSKEYLSLASLCSRLVIVHVGIAVVLLLLSAVLVPLVIELKRQSYESLDDEYGILRSLGGERGEESVGMREAAQVLALILPHGVNNIGGSTVGLDKLLFNGTLVNIAAAGLFVFCGMILRSNSVFAARLALSLVLTADLSLLLLVVSSSCFGSTANIKLPFCPLSVWTDLLWQLLAIHRLYPVTVEKYANIDIASIANTHDLTHIDRLSSFTGLRLLHKLFHSSNNGSTFAEFLLECVREVLKDFRHGTVPLAAVAAGIVLVDVVPLTYVTHISLKVLPNVLRTLKPYRRVLLGPVVYLLCCLALARIFLCNYPTCTMNDHIPTANYPQIHQDNPKYLLFTKSFLTRPGHPRTAVDVFLPPTMLLKALKAIAAKDPSGRISPLPRQQCLNFHSNFTETGEDGASSRPLHPFVAKPRHLAAEAEEAEEQGKTPTFISATRYNRRMGLRWPFTSMKVWGQEAGAGSVAIWTWPLTRGLVEQQFPVVVMDARGTGASQGIRLIDLDEPEIEDFNLVAQWTKTRFWSNGILAGGGVSYDGLTALKLAARPNSPLDIVVAMYSPLHPVTDLLQNNGMACRSFVDDYAGLTKAFERKGSPLWHWLSSDASYIPFQIKLGFLFTFRLPSAPRGWEEGFGRTSLYGRIDNWDMKRIADTTLFTDDHIVLPGGRRVTAQEGGVNEMDFQRIIDRKIPSYWSAGLCDSTAVRRMEALFPRLNHEDSFHRLVIGPWGHGGRRGCGAEGTWACGDDDGFRDMVDFVRKSARALKRRGGGGGGSSSARLSSSRLSYVDGGVGWRDRPLRFERRKAVQLSFGDRLEVSKESWSSTIEMKDFYSAMNPRHLVAIPEGLWWDLREHFARKDWSGVGHDVSEIALVLGSRLNQILSSLQTLIKVLWRQLLEPLEEEEDRPPRRRRRTGDGVSWVELSTSSDFATTGSLSRWSIVQHLMRMPLDTQHVLQCSQKLRALIQKGRRRFSRFFNRTHTHTPSAPTTMELWSRPLKRSVIAEGIPRIQIPFLLLREDIPKIGGAHLDWAVVAVLQTDNRYLTEGRALTSFASRVTVPLYDLERDLPAALSVGNPLSASAIDDLNLNRREDFRPISDLFAKDETVQGVLVFLRFQLESISTKLPKGSKLHLTLLPEDYTNFPWKRTAHKMQIYGNDPTFAYSTIHQAQKWRIPIAAPNSTHTPNLGWLLLPLASDDLP